MFIESLTAAVIVMIVSLLGVVFVGRKATNSSFLQHVFPLTVGVLIAITFIELLPESMAVGGAKAGYVTMAGFVLFYALSHFFHNRLHAQHKSHSHTSEAALLLLVGDAVHNFADGVVIAGAFLVSPEVGLAATFAIILHEAPQEIVEFGVLVESGYSTTQALLRNLLSASTVVAGVVLSFAFTAVLPNLLWVLTAFVAGNLLYVAAAELLPRVHDRASQVKSFGSIFLPLLIGVSVTSALLTFGHEYHAHGDAHEHEEGHAEYELLEEHSHDEHDDHNEHDNHEEPEL